MVSRLGRNLGSTDTKLRSHLFQNLVSHGHLGSWALLERGRSRNVNVQGVEDNGGFMII
jgi:hypothetical protein